MQEGKLPLHYAAAESAPFKVIELLLPANRQEAAAAADEARTALHVRMLHALLREMTIMHCKPPSYAEMVFYLTCTGQETGAAPRRHERRAV